MSDPKKEPCHRYVDVMVRGTFRPEARSLWCAYLWHDAETDSVRYEQSRLYGWAEFREALSVRYETADHCPTCGAEDRPDGEGFIKPMLTEGDSESLVPSDLFQPSNCAFLGIVGNPDEISPEDRRVAETALRAKVAKL